MSRDIMAGHVTERSVGFPLRHGVITAFVERHLLGWEGGMAGLAVIYLAVGVLADESHGPTPVVLASIGSVFVLEFMLRLWDAPSRLHYLRSHWIDLVSCLPLIGGLRSIRMLRILRLAALGRAVMLSEHYAQRHGRQSLWFVGPSIALLWLGSATAYWMLEKGANAGLHTFGDALYWSFITATTVGYGDVVPVTPAGRVLAGIVVFVGIGLVGFASARLTARFLQQQDDDSTILAELASLRTEIGQLRELLTAGVCDRDV